jgi:hypothetical protein
MYHFEQAVPIGAYKDAVHLYKCYQIDDFYVETKRHIELDVLHGLRPFKNPDQLMPYLDQMHLEI